MSGGARAWVSRGIVACWLMAAVGAQELDTIAWDSHRGQGSLIEQIADPEERSAFRMLYRKEKDPARRLQLAEQFTARFPASRMLTHVWEAAAKASIDTGQLEEADRYARLSLRLLPENPLLLVPIAEVRASLGKLAQARQAAEDALEYLDRFVRPASISEKDWLHFEPRLRALCQSVLGRVALEESFRRQGTARMTSAAHAEDRLQKAYVLNPDDANTAYLLGMARKTSGRLNEAAVAFQRSASASGRLGSDSRQELLILSTTPANPEALPWDAWLARLRGLPMVEDHPPEQRALEAAARYAGSAACRECHAREYESWRRTGMAKMVQEYRPENVLGDFLQANEYRDGPGRTIARMIRDRNGSHRFSIRDARGTWHSYPVDFIIGSKWQQAYGTRLPDGRMHVFPLQYSKLLGEWVNFWKMIDPPGSPRAVVEDFPALSPLTSYQTNCAPCHTSQLRTQSGEIEAAALRYREPGVNCEMCHGPSAAHAAARRAGTVESSPPVSFRSFNHRDAVAICAQCHMQSRIGAKVHAGGAVNYTGRSGEFFPRYRSRPYAEFSAKAFYADGRFRETTFIVEAFTRTACYRKGGADCASCHNPHPDDPAANPTSLKYLEDPDRMCTQCHFALALDAERHTRHPSASSGARCAACHMPKIMNSMLFRAASHQIDETPDVAMTRRFGHAESPNACLLCHTEKSTGWLEEKLSQWR